jgi:hypothetical protein
MSMPSEVPLDTAAGALKDALAARQKPIAATAGGDPDQLVFTVRAGTGEILKAEKVDTSGKRSPISTDEAVALTEKHVVDQIEAALDDAFETGIKSMLDSRSDDDDSGTSEESEEDQQLRRQLLTLIVGEEPRQRLRHRLAGYLFLFGKVQSPRAKMADA